MSGRISSGFSKWCWTNHCLSKHKSQTQLASSHLCDLANPHWALHLRGIAVHVLRAICSFIYILLGSILYIHSNHSALFGHGYICDSTISARAHILSPFANGNGTGIWTNRPSRTPHISFARSRTISRADVSPKICNLNGIHARARSLFYMYIYGFAVRVWSCLSSGSDHKLCGSYLPRTTWQCLGWLKYSSFRVKCDAPSGSFIYFITDFSRRTPPLRVHSINKCILQRMAWLRALPQYLIGRRSAKPIRLSVMYCGRHRELYMVYVKYIQLITFIAQPVMSMLTFDLLVAHVIGYVYKNTKQNYLQATEPDISVE